MSILDTIIANKKLEVERQKTETPLPRLAKQLTDTAGSASFKQALLRSSSGIIAEFKRKSPSRGWIFEQAKVEEVIPAYSQYGASAISVLTDTAFFGGTFDDFRLARSLTDTPLLRKDFIVDEYQIYQAKLLEANVILLIASGLTVAETKRFAAKAHELGLETLLEIHNEDELSYVNENVDVIGVNNRNLNTFVTDVQVSFDLAEKIPAEFVKISESGISQPQTVIDLRQAGFMGFLMGENFMKTGNPGLALNDFIRQLQ
ncbi:MAG: indole-3-glycerol phosphate synthase TrpC [Prevotella sp.]|nr:indole-3-glycerol phosphate synthase TrpC [Prevotella sp.]